MLEPNTIARYVRELRAMLRTAGDEDPEGFAAVDQLLRQAVAALPAAAELNRRQHGYSWAELGRALGISRQAAQQRLAVERCASCENHDPRDRRDHGHVRPTVDQLKTQLRSLVKL
jgi:hypothetical protein